MVNDRESRLEDKGLMKIIGYWPILVCVFTGGAWYQSQKANATITEKLQAEFRVVKDDHEHRITKLEDAITYLAQIAKDDRQRR